MRKSALKDVALVYAEVGQASKAAAFVKKLTRNSDEARQLLERLARIYRDRDQDKEAQVVEALLSK
ncbi:MAG: hypothetical protein AAFX99_09900 [Myxococcota bacterium]